MNPHWILVMTQQGKERLATQNMGRQGYTYYLPMIREQTSRNGIKVEVAKPLFPRYIFVHITGQWSSLTGTYGVSALVMDGKSPRYVPERIVEGIRKREDDEGFVVLDDDETLKVGQPVRVSEGVFSGHIGVYQGMSPDERAIVLFQLLGGKPAKVSLNTKLLITI